MEIINMPARDYWDRICVRNIPDDSAIDQAVSDIISAVKLRGDHALLEYARCYDNFTGNRLSLSVEETEERAALVNPEVASAIKKAADNIAKFHRAQISQPVDIETRPGVRCTQRAVPIDSVGLYIPGGRAPLFSTVLMLAIPASIAGCREIILCTPENGDTGIAPEILYAARLCGVSRIFRIGGAQAIAAMAFGTATVPRVNKIFGPGNRYVTKAKQLISRFTAIDMPAGPSEVMVLADETSNPAYVAADLLSQAEHGPDSQAMVICTDITIANRIAQEVERLSKMLRRCSSIEGSLSHSRIIVMDNLSDIIDLTNTYAPEHLIISMDHPWDIACKITAAGSVFIGNYSPESAGDYASGTNHTLPTSGWASSYSGVNIDSFTHKITYQELTREGLDALAHTITTMAYAEGLDAHALAVDIRIKSNL
ncbi:MAG: histidinol dehydrogenase [Muribaculaceae bacterium]|nr:histidinol dehydrogenase [Muribaculaceae bacterium]